MSSNLDNEDSKSEISFDEDDIPFLGILTKKRPWPDNRKNVAARVLFLCIVSTTSFAAGYMLSSLANPSGSEIPFGTYLNGFNTEFG